METSPQLAGLRADPGPLLAGCAAAQAALRDWRAQAAPLLEALAAFGAGGPLAGSPPLAALFAGGAEAAAAQTRAALRASLAVLRAHPLAQLPQRHFSNGTLHSVVLATSGSASLSLALIDAAQWRAAHAGRPAASVMFQPGELHVRVLAGSAEAQVVRLLEAGTDRASMAASPLPLSAGSSYTIDGAGQALVFGTIGHSLVSLRLHRRPGAAAQAREYDLASGALIHQAAGDQGDSRIELAMALLRQMERSDAAPVLAALAGEGSVPTRWQALRECLALDSASGLAALAKVAGDRCDPLREPARRLLDALAGRHPAFAEARDKLRCPA